MKSSRRILGFVLGFVLVCTAGPARAASSDLKATLFDETGVLIEQARDEQADVLSPKNYKKALEHYQRAEQAFKRGKSLDEIRNDLRETHRLLKAALETSELGKITFSPVLEARAQAHTADAPGLSVDLWREAENAFTDAAEELEDGDVKKAQKDVNGVVHRYRKAEVDALKTHYLSETRALLQHAEGVEAGTYAPATLQKAREFAQMVETKLARPEYDAEDAAQLSQLAKQTAQHAVQLALEVRKLSNEQNLEKFILQWEDRLAQLVEAAGIEAASQADRDELTAQIAQKIQRYQNEVQELGDQLSRSDKRAQKLQDRLDGLEGKFEAQADARERVAGVGELFNKGEAEVQRNGGNIVIRLHGLNFRSGKADIEPEYFYLLGKVREAINLFPKAAVTIEGHTDSYGDETQNRALSEKRANAIRDYILSNAAVNPSQIKAVGLGENNPLTTNDTPEGRSKNRRIDVVLHLSPEDAPLGVLH